MCDYNYPPMMLTIILGGNGMSIKQRYAVCSVRRGLRGSENQDCGKGKLIEHIA